MITKKINVLLVDDEPSNLLAMEVVLANLSVNFVRAHSGEEALREVLRHEFAVVLLDVRMPGLDGFETAHLIRTRPKTKNLPIIFVTASDRSDFAWQKAYELGAVDFLVKPINPVMLKAKVETFVELFRSKEELRHAERRAVEAEFREQKQLWQTTLASIGDAVIATDTNRRVTFMNAEAERLTGKNRTEAVGLSLSEVFHIVNEHTREIVGCPVEEVLRTSAVTGVANGTLLIAHDGSVYPIDDSAAPIRSEDGEMLGAVLVFRDITEKHEADKKLREAHAELERRVEERTGELARERAFLSAVLQAVEDGIVACDADGNLTLFNRATRQFHGLAEGPVAPEQWPQHYDLYRADGKTRLPLEEVPLYRALKGERVRDQRIVIAPKNGTPLLVSANGHSLVDPDGRKLGAFVSMHDLTAISEAEAARDAALLEQARREQAEATAELIRDNQESLRRLAAELSEANRRKSEFLATLAHELRNPLAPLRNGLEVLRLASSDPATFTRTRDMMERQLSHMVHLIDELLDIARISQGKVELKKTAVDMRTVVADAVETALPLIESNQHTFNVALPDDPLIIEVDPNRIAQVVANLLNNAAKYTPAGGTIELSLVQEGDEAIVSVSDSGIGIPQEAIPVLFEMFAQISHHMDRAQGGLGIGLNLVKRLVDLHRGTVTASSPGVNQGSTFAVRLPITLAETARYSTEAETAQIHTGRTRPLDIIIVDDNRDAADSLSLLLKLYGHTVRVAHDGRSGVELISESVPDVVFLDIGMPIMNGYEVARTLRKTKGIEHLTLVALTGWGSEHDRTLSKEAGFDFHLTKPAQLAAVEELLCNLPEASGETETSAA